MPFVSVTRLRISSVRHLLPFMLYNFRATSQIKRSEGFLKGKLMIGRKLTFWTMTLWSDEQSMKKYRNTGAHLKAMPKLIKWSNEASVVSWTQQTDDLPTWQQAYQQLQEKGRPSKVNNPTKNHLTKQIEKPKDKNLLENQLYPTKSKN